LAGAAFAFSGVAALVYEVAWQRMLLLHGGAGIYSIAMVVAAFLAGLGGGSLVGGLLSQRLAPRNSLAVFAALELSVGIFALASPWVYTDVLRAWAPWIATEPWHAGVAHFVALLLPTLLMGMSLPLLVRALVRDVANAARRVGFLYGMNVLGAALGALFTPWVLIRHFGIQGAVVAGAVASVIAATVGLLVGENVRRGAAAVSTSTATRADTPPRVPLAPLAMLAAFSGFAALSLEILWFRILNVATKATAFTFGTVLALYLLGTGVGAALGAAGKPRVRRPLAAFLASQALLLSLAGGAIVLLARLSPDMPIYDSLIEYWSRYEPFLLGGEWDKATVTRLYLLLPLLLLGAPTMLMGWSFVALQRVLHETPETGSRRVGLLQAANLLGCVAGSLLTALTGLNYLGTPGAFRVLMLLGLSFALIGFAIDRGVAFVALAGTLAALYFLLPDARSFWLRLHGERNAEMSSAYIEEGAGGVAVIRKGPHGAWQVRLGGRGISLLPYGSIHTWLGAVPILVHPDPRDVAVIGLGSGNTAWAAAWRRETRQLDVFELSAPLEQVLRRFASEQRIPELRSVLADPRVQFRIADGRNALERGAQRYDVIESDALNPSDPYSGMVFSEEFFRSCGARLKPGGVICAWAPTPHVTAAFLRAFPSVVALGGGQLLLGADDPIAVEPVAWTRRLAECGDVAEPAELDELRSLLATAKSVPAGAFDHVSPNRDLFPRDEFASPP
jgi:predicted membrane-bound spermidine synthase